MNAFISISLVYLGIYTLSTWSLNLQYGYTGILNFAYISFVAIGGYTYAVLTLGPQPHGSFQRYFFEKPFGDFGKRKLASF